MERQIKVEIIPPTLSGLLTFAETNVFSWTFVLGGIPSFLAYFLCSYLFLMNVSTALYLT